MYYNRKIRYIEEVMDTKKSERIQREKAIIEERRLIYGYIPALVGVVGCIACFFAPISFSVGLSGMLFFGLMAFYGFYKIDKCGEMLERLEYEKLAKGKTTFIIHKHGCCIIATCALPSQHPDLQYLRRFRDEVLRPTGFGRLIIWLYYATSPPLALMVMSSKRVKKFVRRRFIPLWIKVCKEWERRKLEQEKCIQPE
jgi:hypothetical protein